MGKNLLTKRRVTLGRTIHRKRARHFMEALESRTLMSGTTDLSGALLSDAPPTTSTPLKRYRVSPLFSVSPADNGMPAIDLSSQQYFQLRKEQQEAVPVITQDATVTNVAADKKSVDLWSLATYAGVGGDTALSYTWSAITAPAGATPTFSVNGNYAAHATHVTFDRSGAYTFNVSISDGRNSVTENISVMIDAIATRVTVNPNTLLQMNLGSAAQFTASVMDQFNRAANLPVNWTRDGVGSINSAGLFLSGANAGSATVHASSGGFTADASVSVASSAPVVAIPAAAPASITGQSAALSVLGADDGGEANLTYTWSVVSKPNGFAPNFSLNGTNAAKNTTANFFVAGNYSLLVTISDGSQNTTSTVNFTVTQTITSIGVGAGTTSVAAGQTTTLTASAADQFGNAMTTLPAFTWTRQSGVGSVNSAGVYTAGPTMGTATISASANGVSGAVVLTVINGNTAPTIATAASTGTSNVTAYGTTIAVLGADDGGEANLSYNWSAISLPAGAAATFSNNNNNAAKYTWVNFNKAGTYTLRATISDGSLTTTSDVSLVVSQTLASIIVSPGTTGLTVNGTQGFSAQSYDQFGYGIAAPITWSKASGVGSINAVGVYSAGTASGNAVIVASSGGINGTASITVGNGAPTIAINAAAGSTTVAGKSTTLSVLGADDGGEGALTYSWSAIAAPGGANPTFSVNGNNAAKNATITFDKAGAYTLRATVSDGTTSVTSDVSIVVSQTLAWINVTPGSAGLILNGTQQFSAAALDQFGAAMSAGFSWSKASGVGAINGAGLYSAGITAGSAVIRATVGGISGSANISVGNTAPVIVNAASASATSVTGTTVNLAALGNDDAGEANLTYAWSLTAQPAGATPAFSANGTNAARNVAVSFNKAGAYSFLVTISDGSLTVSSSVTLTVVQALTNAAVSPGSASIGLGASQVFTATAYDQFGAPLAVQPGFTWSVVSGVGAINSSGVFSAGVGGNAVIRATSGAVNNTAAVAVTNAAPTIVTPATASGLTSTTVNLSILGNDDGGAANLFYYWSVASAPAGSTTTFSASGSFAAKNATATFNRAGNYTILATISDGANLTYSSTTVTVAQVASAVTVSPGGISLAGNGTYQFSAAVADQFGQSIAGPAIAWSVDSGGPGTINSTGLFTATNANGTATIRATSGAASGVAGAVVSATNAAPTIVNPAATSGQTANTVNLSVLGNDDGGAANIFYYWSLAASPVGSTTTFSASGSNAAKNATATFNRAGNYTFLATLSDGVNLTYSSVTFSVAQVATSLVVSPGGVSVAGNATYQFTAAVSDQFGQTISSPAVTWSVDSGGPGTINSGGLFTAANTSGTATIRAVSGAAGGVAGAVVTAVAPPPPATGVQVTTRAISNFTELYIVGTSGNDSIYVTQSGNTFTITANGVTQNVTGVFGDLMVKAGSGGSNITVDASVHINTLMYGGAGNDVLTNHASGSYTSIVSLNGGVDTLNGNGVSTNYWADANDTVNASSTEYAAKIVNQIGGFFQPWTGDTTNPDYVSMDLNGQNLRDPIDQYSTVHYSNRSLWGTGPVTGDVHQYGIGDCFLMADIEAVAGANPARLEAVAVDLGDGTYAVRFKTMWSFAYYRIDADFGGQQAVPGASGNVWAVVLEKAYAYFRLGQNSYGSLWGGWMTNVTWDFGWAQTGYSVPGSAAELAQLIDNANATHAGLSVGTGVSIQSGAPIVASHAYVLSSYSVVNGVYTFFLRNPWGFDGVSDGSDPSDGIVGLTFTQITTNFQEVQSAA